MKTITELKPFGWFFGFGLSALALGCTLVLVVLYFSQPTKTFLFTMIGSLFTAFGVLVNLYFLVYKISLLDTGNFLFHRLFRTKEVAPADFLAVKRYLRDNGILIKTIRGNFGVNALFHKAPGAILVELRRRELKVKGITKAIDKKSLKEE
ncbi:MAG: hypothetical protein ACYTHM_24100 [Planctomycetota bacterium]